MKKFTVVSLIVCGVCLVLGLVLLGVGSALGAKPDQYLGAAYIGPHNIGRLEELTDLDDYDTTFEEGVRELDISVSYGQVVFQLHDETGIRVIADNAGSAFRCNLRGKELSITDNRKGTQEELKLTVFLPKAELAELDVDLGAGVLNADQLQAREFGLDVGGGECVIGTLISGGSAELNVGAGRIEIGRFEGRYLDGECGAGELDIWLAGSFEDYNYELDVAMGEIELGDNSYSGLANEQNIRNNAAGNVELDCAMGSIRIQFDQE